MPKVTAIERQKQNRSRFSIFIDGDYRFGCSSGELANLNLCEGDDLSTQELESVELSLETSRIRQRALAYLARRNRSHREMTQYLKRKGFDSALTQSTIDWLVEKKYLNDDLFAEQWVDARLRSAPRGRHKLLAELLEKGIDRELAARVIEESLPAENEAEVAYQLLRQRKNNLARKERLEMKRKVLNFLRYRGFSTSSAIIASNRFLEEMFESSGD